MDANEKPRPPRRPTLLGDGTNGTATLYVNIATLDPSTGKVSLVLDVSNLNLLPGAQVIGWVPKNSDNDNQLWTLTSDGFIVSRLNGLVLDVFRDSAAPGTQLITYSRKTPTASNQQWSMNEGTVQNQLGDLVLDLTGTSEGSAAVVASPSSSSTQRWELIPGYPLQAILAQPAVPFPVFTGQQAAAFDFINKTLGFEVRSQYTNVDKSASSLLSQVQGVQRPDSIQKSDWDAVQAQLMLEIDDVGDVDTLFATYSTFNTDLFLDKGTRLNGLVDDLELDPETNAVGFALTLLESVLYTVLSTLGPEASAVANILAGALSVGLASGDVSPDSFDVAVDKLWDELSQQFEGLNTATMKMKTALLSDWGRLQAAEALINAKPGPSSLSMSGLKEADLLDAGGRGYAVNVMQMLMPLKFKLYRWSHVDNQTPYQVNLGDVPASALYVESVGPGSGLYTVYVVTTGTESPSDTVMNGDIWGNGVSQQTFFTNGTAWPFEVSERNLGSNNLLITIINQTGVSLSVTAAKIHGAVIGGATRPLPAWAGTAQFAGQFTIAGLAIEVRFTDSQGENIASFIAHQKDSLLKGTLPWVDTVNTNPGYAITWQATAGDEGSGYPGEVTVTFSLA